MNDNILFLPYKAITNTKKEIDFNFSLDKNTISPIVINEIISLILSKISQEIDICKPSNGDIIQAICMALVIRCKMIDYDFEKIEKITFETLKKAFNDAKNAKVTSPSSGNA